MRKNKTRIFLQEYFLYENQHTKIEIKNYIQYRNIYSIYIIKHILLHIYFIYIGYRLLFFWKIENFLKKKRRIKIWNNLKRLLQFLSF